MTTPSTTSTAVSGYASLRQQLYVGVATFECDVSSGLSSDFLVMGRVASFGYECFAQCVDVRGRVPEFNNKQATKKYSLTVGRGQDAAGD